MWWFEKILSPLSQDLWPLNLAGGWLRGGSSAHKCFSYERLHVFIVESLLTINLWLSASYDFLDWLFLESSQVK